MALHNTGSTTLERKPALGSRTPYISSTDMYIIAYCDRLRAVYLKMSSAFLDERQKLRGLNLILFPSDTRQRVCEHWTASCAVFMLCFSNILYYRRT
jgi:hypothetical protein